MYNFNAMFNCSCGYYDKCVLSLSFLAHQTIPHGHTLSGSQNSVVLQSGYAWQNSQDGQRFLFLLPNPGWVLVQNNEYESYFHYSTMKHMPAVDHSLVLKSRMELCDTTPRVLFLCVMLKCLLNFVFTYNFTHIVFTISGSMRLATLLWIFIKFGVMCF